MTACADVAQPITAVTAATARNNFFRFRTTCISSSSQNSFSVARIFNPCRIARHGLKTRATKKALMHHSWIRVILLTRVGPAGAVPLSLLLPFSMSIAEDDVAAFCSVILEGRANDRPAVVIPRQ